jgi:hypothetical protein
MAILEKGDFDVIVADESKGSHCQKQQIQRGMKERVPT